MNFFVKNLLKKQKNNIGKFDITTCLGTLHAFDNLEIPIKNLFNVSKKKGLIVIFTLVNSYDVNVISRYQKTMEMINLGIQLLTIFQSHIG